MLLKVIDALTHFFHSQRYPFCQSLKILLQLMQQIFRQLREALRTQRLTGRHRYCGQVGPRGPSRAGRNAAREAALPGETPT